MPEFLPFLAKLTLWCALPFALRPLLARRDAATRHLLLTLTLAGTLVLPILLTATPKWLDLPGHAPAWLSLGSEEAVALGAPGALPHLPEAQRGEATDRASSHAFADGSSQPSTSGTLHDGILHGGTLHDGAVFEGTASHRPMASGEAPPGSILPKNFAGGSSLSWFLLAWCLGAVGVSCFTTLQLQRARRLVREATDIVDDEALAALAQASHRLGATTTYLRESPATPVPFAWRGRASTIVLPAHWRRWNAERLTVVLIHELAHLHRKDSVALWIGRAAAAIWWFHPLVHRLDRWARKECERAADDAVLLSGSRPSDYADHLLAIGRALARPVPAGVSLMMSKSPDFKQRLTSILRADQPRKTLTRSLALGATFVALAIAVTLAGVHFGPTADAQEQVKDKAHHQDHDHDSDHDHVSEHGKYKAKYKAERAKTPSQQAMTALREGRYSDAIAGFEAAAAAGERPSIATYNAACAYSLAGRSGEALDALNKALSLGFDDLDLLTEDSDLDPLRANPSFQALVDDAFAKAGETRDPIDGYRYRTTLDRVDLLRQANSQDPDAWEDVGRDLLYMGEPDAAAEAYSNAIRLDPEPSANTIYNLACVYALDGQKAQALKTLEQAIEAGYSDPRHMKKDGDLASLRGDATFARLIALANDLDLNRYRSALWEEGMVEKAWNVVEKVLGEGEKSSGHNSEYNAAVWAPAIDFYRGFTAKNPSLGAGWFNLGYSLHYSKQFDESVKIFRKAADLGYRPSISTYNVACGLAMLNRVDDAIAALERSLDLGFDGNHLDDNDLDNLRDDPRFRRLALKQKMAH